MERKFREINPGVWKPKEKKDYIEGVLINVKETENNKKYFLEKENHEQVLVWGTTILNTRMKYVNVGDYVRITFVETTTNKKKQDLHVYKVEVAEQTA